MTKLKEILDEQLLIPEYKLTRVDTIKLDSLTQIKNSVSAVNMVSEYIKEKNLLNQITVNEFSFVIYCNKNNRVISISNHTVGGIDGTVIDIRLIYAQALKMGAVAFVVIHNHPTGNFLPSEPDKKMSKDIQASAKIMNMNMLDFIIITANNGYYSFADAGLLNYEKGGVMAFGGLVDEFPIENVNRADLNYILYMLEGNDISFDLDGVNEVLSFDITELNERQQREVRDILMIGTTYQPSRATDTNNFAKGGLYRKRRAYRQKQEDRLVYFVREDNVQAFLKRYPTVDQTMTDYANRYKTMNRAYANWLRWMNNNEAELGGRAETISAPSFGVKTFYKYDWNGVDGWAEIMQYIYTKNR